MIHNLRKLAVLAVAGCTSFAIAQPESVRLSGEVELIRLVDFAAQQLDLTIEYTPQDLSGSVTLRLGEGVSDAELWSLTNRLLASKGLTTIRMPGDDAFSVVRLDRARGLARIEPGDLLAAEGPAPGFVRARIDVRHRETGGLAEAIQLTLSSGGSVEELVENESLLISDLRPRVLQAIELLQHLDRPFDTVIEEITLEHQSASALAARVTQLAEKSKVVTGEWRTGELVAQTDGNSILVIAPAGEIDWWRAQIERFDRAEVRTRETYVPLHHGVEEVASLLAQAVETTSSKELSVIPNGLTGSLIVSGTAEEHEQVAALIARLNEMPASARRPMKSFTLRNRQAEDVLSVIEGLVAAGIFEADTTIAGGGDHASADASPIDEPPAGAGDEPTGAGRRQEAGSEQGMYPPEGLASLSITADTGLNTLIAIGEPLLLERLEGLIAELDVRQPQVEIQVLLISLTESQTRDLGVELEGLIRAGSVSIGLSSLFGLSTSTGVVERAASGSGFTGVVLSPGEFASVIRALETLNEGRSLSTPKVLVSNNEQAVLSSVIQQPTVSINASDTVATTSFGGFEDAGTTITVEPQISEADHLVLTYSVSLSSFVGESSDPSSPPPRQQNQIQSVATIPDGFAIAVGGIELVTEADAESRVPLLGEIPLVKELVRNRSRSNNRSKFYVFIRASVLRDAGFADLKYLSDVAVDEFGIDDGWPEVEPRIIK